MIYIPTPSKKEVIEKKSKKKNSKKKNSVKRKKSQKKKSKKSKKISKNDYIVTKDYRIKFNKTVIFIYLSELFNKCDRKEIYCFWVLTGMPKFKRITVGDKNDVKDIINKDINKYKNTYLCDICIKVFDINSDENYMNVADNRILISVSICMYFIDNKGSISNDMRSIVLYWTFQDFDLTTFSYKLLEGIINILKSDKTIKDGSYTISKFLLMLVKKNYVVNDLITELKTI